MVETTIDSKGQKGSAIQLIRQRQDEDPKAASPFACLGVHKKQTPKKAKALRHGLDGTKGTVLRLSSSYINNQQTSSPAMWSPHRVPGYAHEQHIKWI